MSEKPLDNTKTAVHHAQMTEVERKRFSKKRAVRLWDDFDPETPEPRDWVATNHEMTEDQRLDDQRHDQCRSGKFVP